MLFGTQEEYHYHSARAEEELQLASNSDDTVVSAAHLMLAKLHASRSELVNALRDSRGHYRHDIIARPDKES